MGFSRQGVLEILQPMPYGGAFAKAEFRRNCGSPFLVLNFEENISFQEHFPCLKQECHSINPS